MRKVVQTAFWMAVVLCTLGSSRLSYAQTRPSWTVGGKTYYLYRANLHSHTQYSDAKNLGFSREATNPRLAWRQAATRRARGSKTALDVLAVTEHGGYLGTTHGKKIKIKLESYSCTPSANKSLDKPIVAVYEAVFSGVDPALASMNFTGCLLTTEDDAQYKLVTHSAYENGLLRLSFGHAFSGGQSHIDADDVLFRQPYLYLKGEWDDIKENAAAINQLPPVFFKRPTNFVALHGFEWTGKTDQVGPWYGGHINVFGSVNYTDQAVARFGNGNLDAFNHTNQLTPTLNDFYNWLKRETHYAPNLVAQFNHPTLHDDNSSFNDYQTEGVSSEVREILSLMELGAETLQIKISRKSFKIIRYLGGGDGLDPKTSNEYWFRRALWRGWKVSPTNNGDNHLGNYATRSQRTGIWVEGSDNASSDDILKALKDRKTFATEITDAVVKFSCKTEGIEYPMGTRDLTVGSKTPLQFKIEVEGSPHAPKF